MLTSLQFTGFRGFRDLSLDGLQKVNLIVGKNNSGKTSLLEGIAILLDPENAGNVVASFRQLENDLKNTFGSNQYSSWLRNNRSDNDKMQLSGTYSGKGRVIKFVDGSKRATLLSKVLAADEAVATKRSKKVPGKLSDISICVLSTVPKSPNDLIKSLGTAVTTSGGEELLERTLREVDARIKKIRIVPTLNQQNGTQVVVDIGLPQLTPLSQLGQGIYRIVEIFSEIIGASAKVAFIDEIENGIHHSCLLDLWKGIADATRRFDVQVFATTHSYECIEAAHEAFLENAEKSSSYDFSIIQLFREFVGEQQGRVLDKRLIDAAIAGEIDLRG